MFVQDKLQSLAAGHSDILETLSPKVRKRVEFLREIQVSLPLNAISYEFCFSLVYIFAANLHNINFRFSGVSCMM